MARDGEEADCLIGGDRRDFRRKSAARIAKAMLFNMYEWRLSPSPNPLSLSLSPFLGA